MKNNMMKKLVLAVMLVAGIAMSVPAPAKAAEVKAKGSCGWSARWSLDTDGVLSITGSGSVDDYDSRAAETPWKNYRTEILSVVVGDEITTVGDYAFYGCSALQEVSLGTGVEVIGNHAFANCSVLEKVDGGSALQNLEGSAFRNCTALNTGAFVKEAETIGTYAFYNCRSLEQVVLNGSLTKVPEYAFANAKALTSVTFGRKVTAIGNRAFSNCDSLTEIVIPDSVMTMGKYVFSDCESLKTVTLGKGITRIDSYSFIGCTALDELHIPVSVKEIGVNALTNDGDATIIYAGSDSQWNSIEIESGNDGIDADHLVCLGSDKQKEDISKCTATLSYTRGLYTGKGKQPVPTVKTAAGKTLTVNKDYRVSYADNVKPGKASVIISGMGAYAGTLTVNFDVIPAKAQLVSISNHTSGIYISWKKQAEANGYQIRRKTYSATLWKKPQTLENAVTSFTDEAALDGKTYQYQVRAVFTAADGSVYYGPYSDAKAYRRVTAPVLAAPEVGTKAGTCTVRWTPDEKLAGYEVKWSKDSKFPEDATQKAKILSGETGAKYLSGLESGSKYYVKIRAKYTTQSGITYWSAWSNWRSVTVK